MITDEIIKEKIINSNCKKSLSIYNHLSLDEQKYIDNRYNDSESLSETIYRLKNNINYRPCCKTCGNKVKFLNYANGFRQYCSLKCQANNKELSNRRKQTTINRYGVDSIFKSEEYKKIIKETNIKKYGTEYPVQNKDISKKISKKNKKTYSNNKNEIMKKRKNTSLQKYGVENPMQSNVVKEKFKNTSLQKYGVENPMQSNVVKEKFKNTSLQKYGVENPNQNKTVRNKIKQTCIKKYGYDHHWKNNVIKEKRHQTWLNKYGVDVCSQSEIVKKKMSETCKLKYGVLWFTQSEKLIKASNTDIVKEKEFKTKIKNMSYTKSKEEDKIYELLSNKFINVKRQYKDKNKYPFHCDFYLVNEDIWIEYNGSDFHHFKPFEDTDEDKKELELLISKSNERKIKTQKNKSRYDAIIYTWANLDVRKRKIAKENGLNYIEFWNINEAIDWINNY